MTMTSTTLTVAKKVSTRVYWCQAIDTADASGTEEIKAAPGASKNLYLEKFTVWSNAEITIDIGSGESSSAVETILLGQINIGRQETAVGVVLSTAITYTFLRPIKLAANKSLTIDASGAGEIQGIFERFTI